MKNFVGKYASEMEDMLVASAVSGTNVMVISAPGYGKTEMAIAGAEKVCGGKDGMVFIGLDPATPPEVVRGAYDPQELLKTGKLTKILAGTAYDPHAKVIILDEIWRSNDLVFAALIHATSDKLRNPLELPVFWATSNSVGSSERVEALRDRFGMWCFLKPKTDISAIVASQFETKESKWGNSFPSWDECLKVRKQIPTSKSIKAITAILETLGSEATANQMPINPRRITQWSEILARMTIFEKGTNDFTECSASARKAMRYAYPVVNQQEFDKWQKIVDVIITDTVGEALDAYHALAKQKIDNIVKQHTKDSDDSAFLINLGRAIADAQTELKKIGQSDPRVEVAVKELNQMFAKATGSMVSVK